MTEVTQKQNLRTKKVKLEKVEKEKVKLEVKLKLNVKAIKVNVRWTNDNLMMRRAGFSRSLCSWA